MTQADNKKKATTAAPRTKALARANVATRSTVLSPRANVPYRIKVLSQLLSRRLQRRLEPFDLTPAHFLVLRCLWKQDGLAISDIGEKVQQVGGTMTGVIDRMEKRGLIERRRDKEDRRVWRAWMTPKGKELGDRLPAVIAAGREQLLGGISDRDLELFADVLDRIIANANLELKDR